MPSADTGLTASRTVVSVVAGAAIGYLAVLASWPQVRDHMPAGFRWFGQPNSAVTIAIVVIVLILLGALLRRSGTRRRSGAPVAVVAGLALTSAVLGMASYWRCHDESHPTFFTPVIWTVGLVKGGNADRSLDAGACPMQTPVALDVAQLCALTAVFLTVVGAAVALFRSRVDQLRVHFARKVTAIVDMDEDAESLVSAVARTLGKRSTLAVISDSPDQPCVQDVRRHGARVVAVDFDRPETLNSLSLWHKLDRLYLLSADPSSNLARLRSITDQMDEAVKRQRLPLIVRVDDPWQAAAWRAQHFGGSETRWAADAVGKYEVTARKLLDSIVGTGEADRIFVCGTSRLTLALCSDMAQRQLERDYYSAPEDPGLPTMILVAEKADEYREDHEQAHKRIGLATSALQLTAVPEEPTVSLLTSLISEGVPERTVVILVDADGTTGSAVDATTGTRLAVRFPATSIYAWDPDAEVSQDRVQIVGQLRTYRLSMDMPDGQAQDAWERAARLIHDRYAAEAGHRSATTVPWSELDEFYRESNRRQVRNALWMVEKIGGHTWNVWADEDPVETFQLRGRAPLEQLQLMGFERDAAMAMARAEHEDWCRYYRGNGWKYGAERDDGLKLHPRLVDWATIERDPESLRTALSSLATTLIRLRELGYRSRPVQKAARWQKFRRTGVVIAEKRSSPWTWTTRSGQVMQANAGDWDVREADDGNAWSVRDDVFSSAYEPLDARRWRRRGTVKARPARGGEIIETLEGPAEASEGDWVVQGDRGEQWPVPPDEFLWRYEGPL